LWFTPEVVKEPVGLLIGAARRRMKRAVEQRVRPYGLTPQQFWALINIDEAEGPSLGEIADRLRMDAPTASRAVTQLLRRKLVKAEGDQGDRRRLRLWLAPAGRAKIGVLHELAANLRGAAVHGLTAREEETMRALLRKVIANLDALLEADGIGGEAAAGRPRASRSRRPGGRA
jgi:DNA-binding MarR family transcriptional regulator